jgi:hypothetical protein
MSNPKIIPFQHFVAFVKDDAFWNRWEMQISLEGDEETYFLKAYEDASAGKISAQSFDFSKTNVTLLNRNSPSYAHDGEDLFYFFNKWIKGDRFEN